MRPPCAYSPTRREFLVASSAVAGGVLAGLGCAPVSHLPPLAAEGTDVRITRVSGFQVKAERWKVVGKNSRRGVHGKFANDRVVRLETNAGIDGVGSSFAGKEAAAKLIGKDPLSFYKPGADIQSPLGEGDAPLWDLVGKIFKQPTWRLFGGYGPEWVPVYDGSIYFSDLEPEHAGRGIERIVEEVEYSLERGHRAFKIKIGRGFQWMEKEAGFQRDVAVVQAIRKRVGPDVKLMVDANNGYDLATAKRFIAEAGVEFYFVEEMFPESVEEDLELMAWLRGRGQKTLVADGESARTEEHFDPFIKAGALEILQGDIRRFGFTRLLRLARTTAQTRIRLAPHNWGSFLGGYMQLVLGRGIPNFLIAELDPGFTDLFDTSGFELKDGKMGVPDSPGCGLTFRAEQFAKRHEVAWRVG